MVQRFFFPSGFLVLVSDRGKFSFLHSIGRSVLTGIPGDLVIPALPHCCFPGFGAFKVFSTFSDANAVVREICRLEDFHAWVVKIRPALEIIADNVRNHDCMYLSQLDDDIFGDWWSISSQDLFKGAGSKTEFLINKITVWNE